MATKVESYGIWNAGVLGSTPAKSYQLQVINRGSSGYIMVGLSPKENFLPDGQNFNQCGYYLNIYNGNIYSQDRSNVRPYHTSISNNSIIEIIYKNQEISFSVNNKNLGVAFHNVNGNLYPAVDFYDLASVRIYSHFECICKIHVERSFAHQEENFPL